MWYDSIAERIRNINTKVKEVEIVVNNEDINNVVGHKRENITKLKEFYDVEVSVRQDEKIKPSKFEINVLSTY